MKSRFCCQIKLAGGFEIWVEGAAKDYEFKNDSVTLGYVRFALRSGMMGNLI
jgi:hypothetical protein